MTVTQPAFGSIASAFAPYRKSNKVDVGKTPIAPLARGIPQAIFNANQEDDLALLMGGINLLEADKIDKAIAIADEGTIDGRTINVSRSLPFKGNFPELATASRKRGMPDDLEADSTEDVNSPRYSSSFWPSHTGKRRGKDVVPSKKHEHEPSFCTKPVSLSLA